VLRLARFFVGERECEMLGETIVVDQDCPILLEALAPAWRVAAAPSRVWVLGLTVEFCRSACSANDEERQPSPRLDAQVQQRATQQRGGRRCDVDAVDSRNNEVGHRARTAVSITRRWHLCVDHVEDAQVGQDQQTSRPPLRVWPNAVARHTESMPMDQEHHLRRHLVRGATGGPGRRPDQTGRPQARTLGASTEVESEVAEVAGVG
jgi:hypothetical protein